MYSRINETAGSYAIPSNYSGTALGERENESPSPSAPTVDAPPEERAPETVPASGQPHPQRDGSLLGRIFGGIGGESLLNSDLLLLLIALLVFGEDGDAELPLLLLALVFFVK